MKSSVLVAVILVFGLLGSVYIYQHSEQKKIESTLLLQKQIEEDRINRERIARAERELRERRERELAAEREREERAARERLASLARNYADRAGRQIMSSAGGGQDFRSVVKAWSYDSIASEFEIKMEVYFNGSIFRSNNYNVDGVLTVKRDGSNPKFSRTYANSNFRELESTMNWIGGIAAGVIVLNELSQ